MFLFSTRIVSSPQFTLRYFKENGQLVHRKVTHQTEITLTSSYSSHFAKEGQSEGGKAISHYLCGSFGFNKLNCSLILLSTFLTLMSGGTA